MGRLLWALIVILLLFWLIGWLGLHLAGGFIHLVLVVVVILVIVNLVTGRSQQP